MFGSRTDRGLSHPRTRERQGQPWLAQALNPASLLPGMLIGFLLGLWVELPKGGFSSWGSDSVPTNKGSEGSSRKGGSSSNDGEELKMVFVVRQDLRMGAGKIASQCAHAAVGIYNELLSRNRALLRRWEDCGQPKIVVTCKNQKEMNELRGRADGAGLPTHTIADAGRTQVAAGSKTVLVIGPGSKTSVDAVTRHLRLLKLDKHLFIPVQKRGKTNQLRKTSTAMDVSALKSLKVKMGVCKRVMKELHSYEQEVEREFAKTENMKTSQACPFDIKQQEHVLAESYMMIPNCQKRLETALGTLEKAVSECEAVTTPDECEELFAANQLIAQVKPVFADLQI